MCAPALVISLDKDARKWQAARRRIAAVGLAAERLPAVDGRVMDIETRRAVCSPGCAALCPAAAVGCFMSHRKAWQQVLDRGLDRAFIFEDDVAFKPDAAVLVATAIVELPSDFHVLLLGCFTCQREMLVESIVGAVRGALPARRVSPHLTVPSQTFGSQAYMVSRAGARALLTLLPRMTATVDWQMGAAMRHGLRLYSTVPNATYQADMQDSSIATKAPALLNTILQQVPADEDRSIAWILSVPLVSPLGIDLSAWAFLFLLLACTGPTWAWVLLAVDAGVGCALLSARPQDYAPLAVSSLVGTLARSAVLS